MPPTPETQPPPPVSRVRTLPLVGLGLAGVLFLGGYVLCGDRVSSSPQPEARTAPVEDRLAGLRPMTSGRVPKLRAARPERPPALARPPTPSTTPSSDPRERMAPLITMYGELFEVAGLDATEMRELRRLLHQAHQWVLRPALGNNPAAKREQALALLGKQLNDTLRPEQAERIMAHPFVLELLSWNEPFFDSDARGLVSVRNDLMPREAKGASYVPESTE